MELYLMRHGLAAPAEQDAERGLTPAGRAAIERVAWRAATAKPQPEFVYHSGLRRAEQTAEILARHLGVADRVQPRDGLQPEDPTAPVADWLLKQASGDTSVVLVGHLPFLDELASLLVVGRTDGQLLAFEPGALVKLMPRPKGGGMAVCWMLAPGVV